jgi:ribokinase
LQQGFPRALLTLGARGALLADASGDLHVDPFEVPSVDTTGAGDAFIGSLAVFLAEGLTPAAAVRRANLYAALSTTRAGAQQSFPRRDEFEREWQRRERQC